MTTSAARAKGSQWERDTATCLRSLGLPNMERRYANGVHKDCGDLDGIPGCVVECKSGAWNWSMLDELAVEMNNAEASTGAVLLKRRGKPAVQGAAVLHVPTWVEMLRAGGWCQ